MNVNVWLAVLLLYSAPCVILPILSHNLTAPTAEGIRAVFFPWLAGKPKLSGSMRRVASAAHMHQH